MQTGVGLKQGIGTGGLYSQTDAYIKDNYIRGVGAVTAKAGVVVTAGSIAVRDPALVGEWLVRFGAGRIIIGADFKDDYIAVSAWTEQSTQTLHAFIGAYLAAGATTFICTDVRRDGQLQGPAIATYTTLRQQYPEAQLVASGGVTTVADVAALRAVGMAGAIIGKALYEGTITEEELRSELAR